jgi:hypothetical protein
MLNDILTGKASNEPEPPAPEPPAPEDPYRRPAVELATCTGCGNQVRRDTIADGRCATCTRVAQQAVAQAMSAQYQQQAYQFQSIRSGNDYYWVVRVVVTVVAAIIVAAVRCSMYSSHSHYYY